MALGGEHFSSQKAKKCSREERRVGKEYVRREARAVTHCPAMTHTK